MNKMPYKNSLHIQNENGALILVYAALAVAFGIISCGNYVQTSLTVAALMRERPAT